MASINFLQGDRQAAARYHWQVLKPPTGLQTILDAAQTVSDLRSVSFVESNVYALDVTDYEVIRVMTFGEGSDTNAPVIQLYGWVDSGPGCHSATVTSTMTVATTTFGADNAHKSIKTHFPSSTTWRTCDTYTFGATDHDTVTDVEAGTTDQGRKYIQLPVAETNFPMFFNINLRFAGYKYLVAVCTDLGSATSAGMIFRPVRMIGD